MGTTDLSRISFNDLKHYSRVLDQQGRVTTDADQIEDETIHAEEQRRAQADIIGGYGSPDDGFRIDHVTVDSATGLVDFTIEQGSVYLGGIRFVQNEEETFLDQSDWQYRAEAPYKAPVMQTGAPDQYDMVYLEGWEQEVTAVEDSSLLEKALGGPDTTTRVRKMHRVRIASGTGSADCADSWQHTKQDWQDNGLGIINNDFERIRNTIMSVSFTKGDTENVCSPSVAGGYLGAENQAIRVQITGKNKFTWGFDNASPLYRVNVTTGTTNVTLLTEPRDQFHWPVSQQVVEILPWAAVLSNKEKLADEESVFFSTVNGAYDPDQMNFGMKDNLTLPTLPGQDYFFMRIWNRGSDLSSLPEIDFNFTDSYTLGNTGVVINFSHDGTGNPDVVPGDFWIIAVRPETPDIIVPWELKDGMHPFGVRRFFAPLAVIEWSVDGQGNVTGTVVHDCRNPFDPLTRHDCCCTYSVGDGVSSKGDFNSIQEAVDHLPAKGGKICVLRGIHTANVRIISKAMIQISGCGLQTIIHGDMEDSKKRTLPVFEIENSQWITLENMIIVALESTAINVQDTMKLLPSREITIKYNFLIALVHAVWVYTVMDVPGDHHIQVIYNRIAMINGERGDVAIFTLADDVLIERNRIVTVDFKGGGDGGGGGGDHPGGGDPGDCDCDQTVIITRKNDRFRAFVRVMIDSITVGRSSTVRKDRGAKGGIQIGCGSTHVIVLRNEVFGGAGHGIILGHDIRLFSNPNDGAGSQTFFPPLTDIAIEENTVRDMELSGISALNLNDSKGESLIYCNDISIRNNKITHCGLKIPDEDQGNIFRLGFGGIILAFAEDVLIRENRVEENGNSQLDPVCGIFILYGERIDVSNNRIINNGIRTAAPDKAARAGYRAGILIRMVAKTVDWSGMNRNTDPQTTVGKKNELRIVPEMANYDATPAVKIHDNVVTQPLGLALLLSTVGPASVVNNQFTSQGIDWRNTWSKYAAAVLILNAGISIDLSSLYKSFLNRLSYVAYYNGTTMMTTKAGAAPAMNKLRQSVQIPGGKVLFTANQSTLDLRSRDIGKSLSAQLIISRDDIAFNNNQTECTSLSGSPDSIVVNTYLASTTTIRSNDNRLAEQNNLGLLSLFSISLVNTAADNQATHCMFVRGTYMEVDKDNLIIIPDSCKNAIGQLGAEYNKKLTTASSKT